MNQQAHKEIHEYLHKAIDELLADYIMHNNVKPLRKTSVLDLVEWSHKQTKEPDLPPGTVVCESCEEIISGSEIHKMGDLDLCDDCWERMNS